MTTTTQQNLYAKHEEAIRKAIEAVHSRTFYAHYKEAPSGKIYGENANAEGLEAFQKQLGQEFSMLQKGDGMLSSDEVSPYTRDPLGISYPSSSVETYLERAQAAFSEWKKTDIETRAGILMESLDRVRDRFFELAYATMHTTGQAFMMSFQASGPHGNDRALEAIALGVYEFNRFPKGTVEWVKPTGKDDIKMEKRYRNVPKGIGLLVGCSTFPVWNSIPGLYADLITGNVAIVKPHPMAIYPIALIVQELQNVLDEQGFDPHTVQLAPDKIENPITRELAEHPQVKLIDYTGGNLFGDYLEGLTGKTVFTEKAGVNSVILDSTDNFKATINNLAFSVSMYSGQMCTCPQNFFVPKDGVGTPDGQVSYQEVVDALSASIKGLATHPKMGHNVMGAIQSEKTSDRVQEAKDLGAKVVLDSQEVSNPDFPKARMASPIVLEAGTDQRDIYGRELFGPVVLVVPTKGLHESIKLAKDLAMEKGAISCAAYTTDPEKMDIIENEMSEAGVPVSFNFTGNFWVNQNAGFSDFHVTGGNPAGNASLTDPDFIRRRFTLVGSRVFKP